VLVVANDTIAGDELATSLRERGGQEGSILVVAPALVSSGLRHEMGDVDDAREPAEERLRSILEDLRGRGLEATGEVGDSDPVIAIGDELQKFPADEIVLIHHPEDDELYAEKGLVERVKRDFGQPLTELVVPAGDGSPAPLEEHRRLGGPERDEDAHGWSQNLPKFRRQDVAAMLVGGIGTLILFILAADCAAGGRDGIHGFEECAGLTLIAGAMFLLNLAHVVGLVLIESVRYRGIWERYLARLTIVATSVAVVAGVVLRLLV